MISLNLSGGSISDLSMRNRLEVLGVIRRAGPITKPEIAARTQLTSVTVTNIVRELEATGWVQASGYGESSGGRRPVLYTMSSERYAVVSVDISGYDLDLAMICLDGGIIGRVKQRTDRERSTTVSELIRAITKLMAECDVVECMGIGVSVPGIVDPETGSVVRSAPLHWRDLPLQRILRETFELPVVVGNQTHAAINGEHNFPTNGELGDFVYVAIGTSIGMGMIVGGEIYSGRHGYTGELGHTIVETDGPLCECGSRGCLEQVASLNAMRRYLDDMRVADGSTNDFESIFRAASSSDPHVLQAMDRAVGYLAISLINLVRLLDPSIIMISGPAEDTDRILFRRIRDRFLRSAPRIYTKLVTLKPSSLGRDARILGCSVWASEVAFVQNSKNSKAEGTTRKSVATTQE